MFLPREERRLGAAIQDELARGRVHSVIRNLLLELKNQGRAADLTEIVRRSFPSLKEMQIVFDEVTDRFITVTYQEEGRPKEFDIFSAGSGFQQFLYLFGFILLRDPTVIMLDEPDVHLHGSLQAVLLEELKRLVQHGKQVLLATHSRELITRVSPENILSLDEGAHRLRVAFDEIRKKKNESWDAATMTRMAREYLDRNWEANKIALADAKDVVLPGLKRWLQENGLGQFSDRRLAEILTPEDLPGEVHELAVRIAEFAGVRPA